MLNYYLLIENYFFLLCINNLTIFNERIEMNGFAKVSLWILLVTILSCNRKSEISPIKVEYITNKWKQSGLILEIGYTVLDQTNTQKIDLQKAIDTNNSCTKTRFYDFKLNGIVEQRNSNPNCIDTLNGKWVINKTNDSLILSNIQFSIPDNQFQDLLPIDLSITDMPTKLKILELKKHTLILQNFIESTLTREIWDANPDIYNQIFPGLYSILPFGYQTKQILYFRSLN